MPSKLIFALSLLTSLRCGGAITLPSDATGQMMPAPYVSRKTPPNYAGPQVTQTQVPYFVSGGAKPPTPQQVEMEQMPPAPMPAAPQQMQAPMPPQEQLAEQQCTPQADGQKVWNFPVEFPVSALSSDSRQRLDEWTAKLNEQAYMRADALQEASIMRRPHETSLQPHHAQQPQRSPQPARAIYSPPPQQSQAPRQALEGPQHMLDKWIAELGSTAQSRADDLLRSIRAPTYQMPAQRSPQFFPTAPLHQDWGTRHAPPVLHAQPALSSQPLPYAQFSTSP